MRSIYPVSQQISVLEIRREIVEGFYGSFLTNNFEEVRNLLRSARSGLSAPNPAVQSSSFQTRSSFDLVEGFFLVIRVSRRSAV
jgi:hypothetical protein